MSQSEDVQAQAPRLVSLWEAAERELGLNPDAGLRLMEQFPKTAALLEYVRSQALAAPVVPPVVPPVDPPQYKHTAVDCDCGMQHIEAVVPPVDPRPKIRELVTELLYTARFTDENSRQVAIDTWTDQLWRASR